MEGNEEENLAGGLSFDHQYHSLVADDQSSHSAQDFLNCSMIIPSAVTGQDVFISSSDTVANFTTPSITDSNSFPQVLLQQPNIVQPAASPCGIVPGSPTGSDALLTNGAADIPLLDDDFLKQTLLSLEQNSADLNNVESLDSLLLDLNDSSIDVWDQSFSNLFPTFSV